MKHLENRDKLKTRRWLSPTGPRFSPRPRENLRGVGLRA